MTTEPPKGGAITTLAGSAGGGGAVVGIVLALQSAGLLGAKPVEKSPAEIRLEAEAEAKRSQALEAIAVGAVAQKQRLERIGEVLGQIEGNLDDVDRSVRSLRDKAEAEFGFIVSRCLDQPPPRPTRRRRARRRAADDDEGEGGEDD